MCVDPNVDPERLSSQEGQEIARSSTLNLDPNLVHQARRSSLPYKDSDFSLKGSGVR